jgi:hypothetical protein
MRNRKVSKIPAKQDTFHSNNHQGFHHAPLVISNRSVHPKRKRSIDSTMRISLRCFIPVKALKAARHARPIQKTASIKLKVSVDSMIRRPQFVLKRLCCLQLSLRSHN